MNLVKTDTAYGAWDPGSIFGPPSSHSKISLDRYDNSLPHSEEEESEHQIIDQKNETDEFCDENSERRNSEVGTPGELNEEDSLDEEEIENDSVSDHERDSISGDLPEDSLKKEEEDFESHLVNEVDSIDEDDVRDEEDSLNPKEFSNEDISDDEQNSDVDGNTSEPELDSIIQDEDCDDSLDGRETNDKIPLDRDFEPLSPESPILEDSLEIGPRADDESRSHEANESPPMEEDGEEYNDIFDLACCKIQKLARGYLVRKIPLQLPPIIEEDQRISSPSPVEDVIMFHQVQKKPSVDNPHSPYYFYLPDSVPEKITQKRNENLEIDREIEHLEKLLLDVSKEFDESTELEDQEVVDLDSGSECEMSMEDSIEAIGKTEVPSSVRLLEILANDDSDWDSMIGSIPTPNPIAQPKQNHIPTVHELRKLATNDVVDSGRSRSETSGDPRGNQQRIHSHKLNVPLISRRHHAALLIQRVVRGHIARRLARQRKEKMKFRFPCPNCGMLEQGGLYCKRCGRRVTKPTSKNVNSKGLQRHENAEPSKKVREHQKSILNDQKSPKPVIHHPEPPQPWNRKQMKERKHISRPSPPTDHSNEKREPMNSKKMNHAIEQPQPQSRIDPIPIPKNPLPVNKKGAKQHPLLQLHDPVPPKDSAVIPLKHAVSDRGKIQQTDRTPDELSPNSNLSIPKQAGARLSNNLPIPKKSQITIPFPCYRVENEQNVQATKSNDSTPGDCGYLGHYYKANPKGKVAQPPPLPLEVMSPPKPQPKPKNPQSQNHLGQVEEKRNSLPVLNRKHSMPQEERACHQEKHRMESTRSAPPRIKEREGEKLSLPPPVRRSHDYENAVPKGIKGPVADLTNNKIRIKGNHPKRNRSSL